MNQANAQQISLAISPPLLEVFIKPGKSILVAYKVQNFGDPVILQTKIKSFEPQDNLGNVKIKEKLEGTIRFSLDNSDIQLEKPFFLKTKDSQQLLLRIRVPEGAPEGDYYYTLLVETEPPPTKEGQISGKVKATIGSNILVTVTQSGKIDIKGKVVLFDTLFGKKINLWGKKIKFFDSGEKIPVVLILENKGKNLLKPQGEIILQGNFGEKAKYEILPQNILSQSQRLLLATPSASVDCDNKNLKICQKPFSILLSGFFLGKYKLSSTIILGEEAPYLFASTSFFAFPFKLSFGVFICVILVIFIIKRFSKNEE
ncbi:MAG: hypothetical protein N2482_03325 [Patescibacteria group bacterium]|nr:hypothetical protein [Patescibacteria group bacterium]